MASSILLRWVNMIMSMLAWLWAPAYPDQGSIGNAFNATLQSMSRVGCDCDCGWAPAGCGHDDGSCCYAKCCGVGPSPTPGPMPSGDAKYCPDPSKDFQIEVEGPPGTVEWTPSGWNIHGQRRVSSKASFDLRGGYVEFDMDLSNAHGGVNTNFYVTFPHQPNCGKSCYCDSGATGGCAEIDFTENNGNCFAATTWHTDPDGGSKSGFGGSGGISSNVHVRAAWNQDGSSMGVDVNGNHYSGPGLADQLASYGAAIYSSQWTGWVPGNCGGDGNLQASSFKVSNLKVQGSVKQGPEPTLCHSPTPVPTPTSAPTPPGPPMPSPAPTPKPSPPTTCAVYDGQNNGGANLEGTARTTSSYGDCCTQCIEVSGCVGYTWVRGSNECWLKSKVDTVKPDSYVVSGSVGTPAPIPSPTPSPSPGPAPTPSPSPSPACTSPVSCHGGLKRKGNRIVDKNGENVQLNGMSMFWSNWAAPFWNGDVVKYLASNWNISIIRCPVGVSNSGGAVSGGYLSDPNGNKARLSEVVDAAIEVGIYVIIDWHVEGRCDAGQSKPFFAEMAQKYGKHNNVMFETCNEPTGWNWNGGLKSYHEQVIPSIREHSDNLIICGTNTWSQDVDDASKDQLADPNVAYTLHFYSSMHKQSIRDKASTAMSNGAAIFVTEWGTEQKGEGNFDETNTWLQFLRQNSISNANWGVYDKDSEAWAIVHQGTSPSGDWSDSQVTNSGKFVRTYFSGKSPPSPGPGPSPTPGTKHCSVRGGCDCDCSWAAAGKCGGDDGSCCYACCCSTLPTQSFNLTAVSIVV